MNIYLDPNVMFQISRLMILPLEIIAILLAFVAAIALARSSSVGRLKKENDKLKKEKEELIKKYETRIKELEEKHRQELEIIGRTNMMLKELKKAIDTGAVKLVCPKHPDAEIQILADGTILCGKDHRLWPPGDKP